MFYTTDATYVTLQLKVQPNANRNEWIGLYGQEAIKVRVRAAAVEGAANKELITFAAKTFRVPKRDIAIIGGLSSKHKRIRFPRTQAWEAWLAGITSSVPD